MKTPKQIFMKKSILLAGCILFLSSGAHAQKMMIKDGMEVSMDVSTWPNMLIADQKFMHAKEEKQQAQVEDRNADVYSGKLAPNKFAMVYKITKEGGLGEGDGYKATTVIGGKEYSSYERVTKDTLYIYRSKSPVLLDNNGESAGLTIQGVEKIPFAIKVGDLLPVYEDATVAYPKTTVAKVKDYVKTGSSDMYTMYDVWDVDVKKSMTISSHTINNVNAKVIRAEDITVNGKTYNAFVIESESWSKSQGTTTFEAARGYINKKDLEKTQARLNAKMDAKMNKRLVKSGFLNDDGYFILTKEEWFVPELGVVKMRSYDMYGAIINEVLMSPKA